MYCNLGFHTEYTIGRSSIQIKKLEKVKFETPIAICENGNISTLVKSLKINKNNIPAVELYVVSSYEEKRAPVYRARIFCFDETSYKNMCKLIELANRNKYYSPRVTIDDFKMDGDYIIIVEPDFLFLDMLPYDNTYVCLNANWQLDNEVYYKYKPIFYYDCYALEQKDLKKVELLSARGFKHETKCWYYDDSHYYYASLLPEAINNYNAIIQKCTKPVVKFDNRYPVFNSNLTQEETENLFESLVKAGFLRKCPQTKEYIDRLNYELGIIKKLNYCNYFLVNWDFINWSRQRNIPIGPGRGSAAGSIIAYCLDITKLDPVANGLYFERFLNPDRVSPPDIDTDINTDDRGDVVRYVQERYGRDRVSQIITFSELKSKSALKDAARLHEEVTAEEINKITSYFPPSKFGIPPKLDEAYEVDLVKQWALDHFVIWSEAKELEGFIRQTGIHAAGVIISPTKLNETIGISYSEGEPVCQLYKDDAEKFGLLKMDFLGLGTLGVLKNTQTLLGMSYYDLEKVSLNDSKVIDQFALGNTHGVFQFEGDGIKNVLRQLKPTAFADIAATNALYRPGPLTAGLVENYIHNKNSINPNYFLPEFQDWLEETYGVMVYQEQIMLIAQRIAGFTLSRADTLRKAIGKKDRELMKTMNEEFCSGCVKNGYAEEKAGKLWTQIVGFADYCFNKSHSYAYAVLAYWCMYLKTYYPKEFAVSLLSANMKDSTTLRSDFYAFKDVVNFLPPYINEAKESFGISKDGVLMGFGSLKGMGSAAHNLEVNAPYKDVVDVAMKCKLDTSQFTSLIYSGAFDKMEPRRGVLLANSERILKYAKTTNSSMICNLFDPVDAFSLNYNKEFKVPSETFMEKECYGFNIYHGFMGKNAWLIESLLPNIVIGNIMEIKRTKTKSKQEDMAILTIETIKGKAKAVLFPRVYDKFNTILIKESIYAFSGKIQIDTNSENEEMSIIVGEVLTEPAIVPTNALLYSKVPISKERLKQLLAKIEPQTGICFIDVYEESGLDDESTQLFQLEDPIHYTKDIHQFLQNNGFRIELNLF